MILGRSTLLPPEDAQYLLRFDDLCPTMDRARWQRFLPLLSRFAIHPILAVVPDNQDPDLNKQDPDPAFWLEMQELQKSGAAIGLHGYQHRCVAKGRSLVNLHAQTEFAGALLRDQRIWIQRGLSILRGHGLDPTIWVAPRHGSDRSTIVALREQGMDVISDGLAESPYRRDGMIWIPQQLWAPIVQRSGLWTITYHPNTASDEDLRTLEEFLHRFSHSFTSLERALSEWPVGQWGVRDRLRPERYLMRIRLSRMRRRLFA
jgi:predicted deacetylase